MIEDYRALAIFVAVADAGSFSEASRRLRLSTSVVSHHISRLEGKLGVSLFFRSTRSLSLAPEGAAILENARKMVQAGEAALDTLAGVSEQPVGSLRISIPAFGYSNSIHQSIWDFSVKHPLVTLSVNCSDARADLVGDGFDLAIRLGVLADSSLKCRRIGDFYRVMAASPKYLEKQGPITTIEELNSCEFVSITMLPDHFTLIKDENAVSFEPENIRLEVDSVSAAKSAIVAGLGVRQLPLDDIQEELGDGRLVRVLPDWAPPITGIYAVWPDIGPQKALTRRLIDHITA